MQKVNVAIIGASGYSGEELIHLLSRHPRVNLKIITSRQYANKKVATIFPRFSHLTQVFIEPCIDSIAEQCEVVFLALPHKTAAQYAIELLQKGIKVIDISADFRLKDYQVYEQYYDCVHPSKDLLQQSVYGAPERFRKELENAKLIACPGCYPTSAVLPLAPFIKNRSVAFNNIQIMSMSGLTGAGRKNSLDLLYSECNESSKSYNVLKHRHIPEIEQELSLIHNEKVQVNFVPHLIPLNRGIQTTIIADAIDLDEAKAYEILQKYYQDEIFVRVLEKNMQPDIKYVAKTNYCDIQVNYDARTNKLILNSAIDNLTKGASGQAVQCFNISYNFAENQGLEF